MMRNPGFSRIILSISRNGRTNEFCYSSSLSPLVTEGGVKDRRDYPWIVNEPVKGITYDLPSEERPDQDHHQASGRGAPPFLPPFLIPPSLPPFLPPRKNLILFYLHLEEIYQVHMHEGSVSGCANSCPDPLRHAS